jgi:[ribosomal protein S5]-alanine N-acetyltransferase
VGAWDGNYSAHIEMDSRMALSGGPGNRAPESVTTARLSLRRPVPADAEAIFDRYSSDPDVTRYVGWPAHQTVDDARAFLAFSDDQWKKWPAGPYLICSRTDGVLVGGTGLMFETPRCAMTGYVLAKDAWGRGYATEALTAMVAVAQRAGVQRLYALCHANHHASAHVLEKCGFALEGTRHAYAEFPNLRPGEPQDVLCFARILENASDTTDAKCS